MARESGGRTILAASSISREDGGKSVSPVDLARGIARGERFAFHGTRASRRMGLFRDAGFSTRPPDRAAVPAIVRWPCELRPDRKGILDRGAIHSARGGAAPGSRAFQKGQGPPQRILPDDSQDFSPSGLDEERP